MKPVTILSILLLLVKIPGSAQDPHFSQYFSSPLTISPAMTGNFDADWRLAVNYRTQWQHVAAAYNTATVSYDKKIMKEKTGGSVLAMGMLLMYDASFNRIVKSNYFSVNLAYHQQLDENGFHHLGLGFGTTYGNRKISFNELTWEEQLGPGGFDKNLPTGETALSEMKPYMSVNTGLVYSMDDYTTHFELGGAAYHINKPKQTFLQDEKQVVPMRYVVHAAFDRLMNEQWFINLNAIFQKQSSTSYLIAGGAAGRFIGSGESTYISAGAWYRSKDAVIPFVNLFTNGWLFGFSYDVTTSKLMQAQKKPYSFELSISVRKKSQDHQDAQTRCPRF
ncbi:MAG TPA: PorP/SprF family type IX secretion system membrane protein [Chitinophagaceae bacterium]